MAARETSVAAERATGDGLTAEQLAAIGSRDADTFCEAGAGSGKTRVLVERYCEAVATDGVRSFVFASLVSASFVCASFASFVLVDVVSTVVVVTPPDAVMLPALLSIAIVSPLIDVSPWNRRAAPR